MGGGWSWQCQAACALSPAQVTHGSHAPRHCHSPNNSLPLRNGHRETEAHGQGLAQGSQQIQKLIRDLQVPNGTRQPGAEAVHPPATSAHIDRAGQSAHGLY